MKKYLLLTVLATVLTLTACEKEGSGVDMSNLQGKWVVANDDPNLEVDGSVSYTFDGNGECRLVVYDVFSNTERVFDYAYAVSISDTKILTLYDERGEMTKQYFVRGLNAGEMKWQEVAYGYTPLPERLVKVNDWTNTERE